MLGHDVMLGVRTARLVFVVLLSAQLAWASGDRVIRAESLFQEGRAAFEAGDYARACPLLEESQQLDPAGGTALALALCYEAWGKTASAWVTFLKAEALAHRDKREDRLTVTRAYISKLEPSLSYLTLVPPSRSQRVVIKQDGVALGSASHGVKAPIDPGQHTFEACIANGCYWTETIEIVGAEERTLHVPNPPLARRLSTSLPEPDLKPRAAGTVDPPQDAPPPKKVASRLLQAGALSLLAAGTLLCVSGSVFAFRAWGHKRDLERHCDGKVCDRRLAPVGLLADREARRATWLLPTGAVATGFGAWWTFNLFRNAETTGVTQVSFVVGPAPALSIHGAL